MKGVVRKYNYNSSIFAHYFLVLSLDSLFPFIYALCYILHVLSNEELLALWYVHFSCQLSGIWDVSFRINRFFLLEKSRRIVGLPW